MKILQIFGAVIAVHVLAFIFIFASPGCQTGPKNIPTPDATVPAGGTAATSTTASSALTYTPQDLSTPANTAAALPEGPRMEPTRPGSANAVAITPPKQVAQVAPVSTYTVQRGDSLWSIAKKNGLTVQELAKANSLATGATLQPGKKLIVPGKERGPAEQPATVTTPTPKQTAPATTTATTPPRAGESIRHTVQPGESLSTIARRYQIKLGDLAAANNINDPTKVRAGQQLIIPGFVAPGASRSASTATSTPKSSEPAAQPGTTPAADPRVTTPKFDLTPPPPGQDLDAGLKDAPTTVPTIKVEDPKSNPPKG